MRSLFVAAVLLTLTAGVVAEDWPEFLGKNRDAKVEYKGLATSWPEDGPPVMWSLETGPGFGGASIVDGEVFLLDRVGNQGDVLRVLDLKTGQEKWRYQYEAEGTVRYHGSRCTPTVDGDLVFSIGPMGDVYCISRTKKKPVWQLNLTKKYEFEKLNWGHAQSPLVYNDKLIVTPTHGDTPALVALNKKTGEVVWESPAPEASEKYGSDYYASPIVRTVAGRTGIMQITNGQVSFVDPETGKMIWKYTGYDIKFAIPAPTVLPDQQHIFVTGGYGDGSVMIKVTKAGDGFNVEELYRLPKDGCQIHPAINYEGYLYANINENDKFRRGAREQGGIACIEPATGKILWRTGGDPFFSRGGVILVGDKLVALDGENGNLHLIDPNPKAYKELARANVLDARKQQAWAPLAFSDGLLIVRDQTTMTCLDLRAGAKVSKR